MHASPNPCTAGALPMFHPSQILNHTKVLVFALTVWVWCTSLVHTIWPTERAFFSAEFIQPIAERPLWRNPPVHLGVVGSIALVEVAFREG